MKKLALLFFCIAVLFLSCDGSVKSGYPRSLTIGNNWDKMKAVGAMSYSEVFRARSVSGKALSDDAVFIAVNEDGQIEDIVLLDETGENVLEGKIVSYYKQRSRFDFINIQSPDNPNYWPFDDWVHTPDDDDALLFVVDKITGKFYFLNGSTSQKWYTDGSGTYEYNNVFLSQIASWENNSVPIGFHKFTFNDDGTLTLDTYWTRDVKGHVWLDRFGNIFYEHYTEDKNGGFYIHGTTYSLTEIKMISSEGNQNSFKFSNGYEIKIGFNNISYLFKEGESVKFFAENGQLVEAEYVPESFKDLNLYEKSIQKGLSEFYFEWGSAIRRVLFKDDQKLEYECVSTIYFPDNSVYGVTEDYFYYFKDGKVTIVDFDSKEEKSYSIITPKGDSVTITMFTEGSRGNINFQGKAGCVPVSGYIMPNGEYYFTDNAVEFDSVVISPVN